MNQKASAYAEAFSLLTIFLSENRLYNINGVMNIIPSRLTQYFVNLIDM